MKNYQDVYTNVCYRGGPCLHGNPIKVSRADTWDYYDKAIHSYIYLECKLHQKHYTPSPLQIEQNEKYQSGLANTTFEHPDLQLADTNGVWFTRSDDPDCYQQLPFEEPKTCNICDIVCDIRDMKQYMRDDGSCPFDDSAPQPIYTKVEDYDRACQDFLHPLILQNIDGINRKRRRATKVKLWGYLKQKKWRDALINKGDRIIDVWKRNYQPVTFYYNSLESIVLYLNKLPREVKTKGLLKRVRENVEKSPSYKEVIQDYYQQEVLKWIDEMVEKVGRKKRRR